MFFKKGGTTIRASYIDDQTYNKVLLLLNRRDQLITRLLDETGYRCDDMIGARCYQLLRNPITIREAKTGKIRTVTISEELAGELREKFGHRDRLSYAFPALRRLRGGRKRQHRTTYWRHFCAAARAAGAPEGASPHSLRKRYAVRLLAATGSLEAVRKDLGHTYLGTTAIYALSDRL